MHSGLLGSPAICISDFSKYDGKSVGSQSSLGFLNPDLVFVSRLRKGNTVSIAIVLNRDLGGPCL